MMRAFAVLTALSMGAAGAMGCAVDNGDLGAADEAIVDGTFDGNTHPAVVLVVNQRGGLCTGTIVGARAVLTAKHCVDNGRGAPATPGAMRVYVGASDRQLRAEYRVSEVLAAPGSWSVGSRDSSDLAMLVLATPAAEEPMTLSFEHPSTLTGLNITAVGYGQTPSGSAGTKYRTSKAVRFVADNLINVAPAVCQGDSGGPLIGPEGTIWGVASFIFDAGGARPTCGTADGVYNGWATPAMEEFIRSALEQAGACIPSGEEVCDGVDNNCDEVVDEGCMPLGSPCTTGETCFGGLCDETPLGRVCTFECNALTPEFGCGIDAYCAQTSGCDGRCLPRVEPAGGMPLGIGATCAMDSDCASLFCADPGDGRIRCLAPCEGDTGMCISGEACAAGPGACGGCVDAAIVQGLRGLGEPCAADEECGSASCLSDDGVSYCSAACTVDDDCTGSFHCRDGACARGDRGGLGAGCVVNADCGADAPICAVRGATSWCTAVCDGECGEGFSCVDIGNGTRVCSPDLGLVGEVCGVAEDCISGLCANTGGGSVCTEICSPERACSAGFECRRASDGVTSVCVAPALPSADGGCSVSRAASRRSPGLGLLLLGVALLPVAFARRRRR